MSLQDKLQASDGCHVRWPALLCLILLPFFMTPVLAESDAALSRIEQFSIGKLPAGPVQKYSVIEQIGHDNQAHIAQSASAYYQQVATIYQSGHHHQASITQQDVNAMAAILQHGDSHIASIYQGGSGTGSHSGAAITQFGTRGRVEITQSSSDQGISVVQHAHSGSARPVTIDTYR